jgi:hypothetical protein
VVPENLRPSKPALYRPEKNLKFHYLKEIVLYNKKNLRVHPAGFFIPNHLPEAHF